MQYCCPLSLVFRTSSLSSRPLPAFMCPKLSHQEGSQATSVQAWCRQRRCRRWAGADRKTGKRVVARRVMRPYTRRSCDWRCRREVPTVSWMRLSSRGLWTDTREIRMAFVAFPFSSAAPPPLSSHTPCVSPLISYLRCYILICPIPNHLIKYLVVFIHLTSGTLDTV